MYILFTKVVVIMPEKNISPPYTCYRCGYETHHKAHIKNHFNRKKICPATIRNDELTDEIKNEILRSRIYRPPPEASVPSINNQIYNYNNLGTIMNVICKNIPEEQRITKFVEYNQKEMLCLCDDIEIMFKTEVRKLRNDKCFKGYFLDIDEIYEVFDKILKLKYADFSDMNIIYNKHHNKFNILDDTCEWEDFLMEKGIKYIIEQVQDGYLHEYERYVVSNILTLSGQDKQTYKEHLREYYKFLSTFNMLPLCSTKNKNMQSDFVTPQIIDEMYPMYTLIRDTIKLTESNELRRRFIDLIKKGCERNSKNFYTEFYNLYNTNENFKQYIENLSDRENMDPFEKERSYICK